VNSSEAPENSQPHSAQHFRVSVRILAGLLCFIITVGCLEIGLRLWSFAMNTNIARLKDDSYRRLYSPEELRSSEPPLSLQANPRVRRIIYNDTISHLDMAPSWKSSMMVSTLWSGWNGDGVHLVTWKGKWFHRSIFIYRNDHQIAASTLRWRGYCNVNGLAVFELSRSYPQLIGWSRALFVADSSGRRSLKLGFPVAADIRCHNASWPM